MTPTGGTIPYSYSWSTTPSQTTQDLSALCAGIYTCNITDANNCTAVFIDTVTQPAVLNVSATANTGCGSACDKSGSATPTGGTAPYTYLWSPGGQTTATATGLCAGSFTVTVTDANGCTSIAAVSIISPTTLAATSTCNAVSCFGGSNGTSTAIQTGGTGPYTYAWSTTPAQTTATATGLIAGTYTCIVTDANGCTTSTNCAVTQPASAVVATAICTSAVCFGGVGSSFAAATGGTSPYTYLWNSTPAQTTATATGLAAGTYTCTVTDANGCTTSATCTVTQPPALSISTSSTSAPCGTCPTGSTTATVTGGTSPYTYMWAPGGCATANCTGLIPGTYTVTVTDANGCTGTQTVVVVNSIGIEEMYNLGGVSVYPNPSSGIFVLETGKINNAQVEITNVVGSVVFVSEIKNTTSTIDLSALPKGVYFLKLKCNEGAAMKKITIE